MDKSTRESASRALDCSNPRCRISLRTVANQAAAIFTKLGVGSRAELFAKYSGRVPASSSR